MKVRIEYAFDKSKDETRIFVWKGMQVIDQRTMPGDLSAYIRKKIREEIQKEYQNK